jgi:hypothetical protein
VATTAAAEAFVTIEQVRESDCPCINEDTPTDPELTLMIDEASDMIAIASGFVVAGRRALIARPEMCGEWGGGCPCHGFDVIPLGDNNPTVTSIKIDGVALTTDEWKYHHTLIGPTVYRIDTTNTPVRPRSWPTSQRGWLADTEEHTFAIYFTEGMDSARYLIQSAVLEVICDMVSSPSRRSNALEGATSATMGNVTVTLDNDRLERIRTGALGPAAERMMGLLAPGGRQSSTVWAPEMTMGWDLNIQLPA